MRTPANAKHTVTQQKNFHKFGNVLNSSQSVGVNRCKLEDGHGGGQDEADKAKGQTD